MRFYHGSFRVFCKETCNLLRFFNTLGKKVEPFRPPGKGKATIFTCGPSVYQRAHIGNFRTFLFEDILVRYLSYSGYTVKRGMNFTDIEDKTIKEAEKNKITVQRLTENNIREFNHEMALLNMKFPDYLPKASEHVDDAVRLILKLLEQKIAYRHNGNIYYDPLKSPGFGKLYGLDMSRWPRKKRRFHRDTYPGVQWNRGDFILWHGYKNGDGCFWDTRIGKGRPSWNIQDPSIVSHYFHETLSFYCGGIDNLYRHHDYTKAILEAVRPYPMAKFWLHCNHLFVNGMKMSKSRGNTIYADTLRKQGYSMREIRFFLIYGHYQEKQNYTDRLMQLTATRLRAFRKLVRDIKKKAGQNPGSSCRIHRRLMQTFADHMDNDLHVRDAFDDLSELLSGIKFDSLAATEAAGIIRALREIDEVLQVIF
jgi:cysteinyl-tRNA synthetase